MPSDSETLPKPRVALANRPNFLQLREMPIKNFHGKVRQTGCVWLFQHIPKTAGSSITRELDSLLPPYRNIFSSYKPGEDQNRGELLQAATEEFLADHETKHFRAASGHLRLPHVRHIRENLPNVRVFTFLRDPVKRLVSDFRYARTEKHPVHAEFIKRFPTFESYMDDPSTHNKMWKFIAGPSMEATEENVEKVLRRFTFIGTLETLEADFAFLTALFGYPKQFATRANQTKETSDNEVVITPEIQARLEEQNANDFAIYRMTNEIISARRAEMDAFVEERRASFG